MSKQSLSNEAPWNQLARTSRYPVHLSEVLDVITSTPSHPTSNVNMDMVKPLWTIRKSYLLRDHPQILHSFGEV